MNGAMEALGSILRIAAASSLRRAADDAKRQMLLAIFVGVAGAAGIICLSAAAFIVMRDQLGAAQASALLGVLYLLMAVAVYLVSRKRPRS